MSTETLIKVEGVSKKFCRDLKKSLWYGMKDLGSEILGHRHEEKSKLRAEEFWAVKDVSFQLNRGECLGLIGRNGAGKTTLLRMLNGLIRPDSGQIKMHGRVSALIALGAGFHPLLTGRENIFVNASILGFNHREVIKRFDEIVTFAGLEDFIDSPVQNYSSGMHARLGFSIAVHCDPDIILIDEALAVGDMEFVIKCINCVGQLRQQGAAVVLVSHNELLVRDVAQRCLLMQHGESILFSSLDDAFLTYRTHLTVENVVRRVENGLVRNGPIRVTSVDVESTDSETIHHGSDITVKIICTSDAGCKTDEFELRFWNSSGQLISTICANNSGYGFDIQAGASRFMIKISALALAPGRYRLAGGFKRQGQFQFWSTELKQLEVAPTPWHNSGSGILILEAIVEGPIPVEGKNV
ncbi:ABC transporter ATP-binding protein [Desulfopila aestuarii]|uniref:ABC-type polysaccharide/polyol phosphate transport system, ATPase component n=1 Tax=Desulfopila aestuarii DSM 18488 TaxID=1121416 RepID=A0A1M7Y1S0_9BACT|nr:ABC transporter ATP-binding protein [Desulfopila aestuarii]SHO45748.1 ABC-type polysaccharide/polyol phosphate transport system, ATPase component [Desulfopila aestuarii DSM 18488]